MRKVPLLDRKAQQAVFRSAVSRPWLWLGFQVLGLLLILYQTGRLDVHYDPDPMLDYRDYVELSALSPVEVLFQYRTLGYPLFLKGVRLLSPTLRGVPVTQYVVHALAVCLFYAALRTISVSGWLSLAISSTLLYSDIFLAFGRHILTDALASSFAIATIGSLLAVAGRPNSRLAWAWLTLSLFFTYQIRPAYLFLVLLVPPLGLLLAGLVSFPRDSASERKRVFIKLVAACFLPLLAFCAFRSVIVGEFGLVSFAGYNLVGIAGRFLRADLVGALPEDVQALAQRALEKRSQMPAAKQDQYAVVIWDVFYPAAVETYGIQVPPNRGSPFLHRSHVLINSKLTRLSLALIKANPARYARWLVRAFVLGLFTTLTANDALGVMLLVLLALVCLWHVCYLGARLWKVPGTADVRPGVPKDHSLELNIMLLVAMSFALGKILLVIVFEEPIERYTDAAGVFLPAVAAVAGFKLWAAIDAVIRGCLRKTSLGDGAANSGPVQHLSTFIAGASADERAGPAVPATVAL